MIKKIARKIAFLRSRSLIFKIAIVQRSLDQMAIADSDLDREKKIANVIDDRTIADHSCLGFNFQFEFIEGWKKKAILETLRGFEIDPKILSKMRAMMLLGHDFWWERTIQTREVKENYVKKPFLRGLGKRLGWIGKSEKSHLLFWIVRRTWIRWLPQVWKNQNEYKK